MERITRHIHDCIESTTSAPKRSVLVYAVATAAGVDCERVEERVDDLERSGEVYLVGTGDPEVRVP